MCFLGLFGVALMIIENEVSFAIGNNNDTALGWFIKLIISISTVMLLACIFYYHWIDLHLTAINNSFENWRNGLTLQKLFFILIEICICAIHPVPTDVPPNWSFTSASINSTIAESIPLPLSYIKLDVAFGLPSMFSSILCITISYFAFSVCSVVSTLPIHYVSFVFGS
jgi:hypothetical protein